MTLSKRPIDKLASSSDHVSAKSHVSPASRSRSTSANNSPAPPDSPEAEASIVLIGIRGTGKSSLAVMASSALGYRVIDADDHFFRTTGQSRAAFNAEHGVQEYKRCELRIMRSVLLENRSRCVITCGPGSVEGEGRVLLEEYAKTHPVIYILRDLEDIQRHLRAWDAKTISELISLTAPAYRASSSYEFYNISESRSPGTLEPPPSHPTLTLKNLQDDFLRLLYHVTKRATRHRRHGSGYEAGHIVSLLPPESKYFTYALTLSLSDLPLMVSCLPDLQSTADAVRFVVDSPLLLSNGRPALSAMADYISKHFYLIRRYTRIPTIFDTKCPPVRARRANPETAGLLEKAYFEMLRFGLRLSPEYICVDMTWNVERIKEILAAKGSTKAIGCFFDDDPGSDGWSTQAREERLRLAEELGFDIISTSQEAMSPLDNATVQRFTHKANISSLTRPQRPCLMAFNTGRQGRVSCWQNSILTPVTHSLLRALRHDPTSDALLTIPEAQNALYSSFTLDKMYFGVLGSKVSTSVSPAAHNAGYKFCRMPHEYKIFQHSSLGAMKDVFRGETFGGASISSPFKREIIAVVDFMSPEAQAIGAVNTLVPLRGDSKDLLNSLLERNRAGPITGFYGECTDWIAIHRCVSRSLSPVNTVSARTTAVVLGAGGMARAAIYAMIRLGVRNIFICNRTISKAQEVADHFRKWSASQDSRSNVASTSESSPYGEAYENATRGHSGRHHGDQPLNIVIVKSLTDPWPENADFPTILVSTLPGRNFSDKLTIDNRVPQDWLASSTGGVIAELAYDPFETPLLYQARTERHRGWVPVDGLQLSLEQAAPQFELFTGRRAPKAQMKAGLLRGYEKIHGKDCGSRS